MKIAICVGHSRFIANRRDGGAVSINGTSEWAYNKEVAWNAAEYAHEMGMNPVVFDHYDGNGYGAAMANLAKLIKDGRFDLAIELHFNCADTPEANGHEWLHWHSSANGKRLAECLQAAAAPILGKPRGVKAITSADRGAEFLRLTPCPAVICEPGFGSNAEDWKRLATKDDSYAQALARACANFAAGH